MQLKTELLVLFGFQLIIFGSLYSFPLWLPDVKDILHTSQQQINVIGGLLYIGSFGGAIVTPLLFSAGERVPFVCIAFLDIVGNGCIYFITQFASSNEWVYPLMVGSTIVGVATGINYSVSIGVMISLFGDKASPRLNAFCSATFGIGAIIPSGIYYAELCNTKTLLMGLFIAHFVCGFTYFRLISVIKNIKTQSPSTSTDTPQKDTEPLVQKDVMTTKEAFVVLITGVDSWVVIGIACLMVGAGTTFATNIPGIVESLDGDEDRIGMITLIFNLVQTAARFSVAIMSITFPTMNPTLPLTFMTGLGFGVVNLVAHFTIASDNVIAFVVIFSVFYGWMWCVNGMVYSYVSIPAEKYFSLIMATVNPGTGVLSLLLNWLVGYLYDRQATGNSCTGTKCFSTAFLILGTVGSLVSVLVFILWVVKRNRRSQYFSLN